VALQARTRVSADRSLRRLLQRLGHEVDVPEEHPCFGQLNFSTGYRREAERLAPFVHVFAGLRLDDVGAVFRAALSVLQAKTTLPGLAADVEV
jgi:Fe-S oxidoreductase